MKLIRCPDRSQWDEILKRPVPNTESPSNTIRDTINHVRVGGGRAVMEYEAAFDRAEFTSLAATLEEIEETEKEVPIELKAATYLAKRNVEALHIVQRFEGKKVDAMGGVTCWQEAAAAEKVGLYIPGGMAPLFSTVLMLVIPTKIAGYKEIVLCTPPDKNGRMHPAILFATHLAGVNKIFKVDGIQVIASMAYGTESIPEVYRIFGPGNQYIIVAKQLVSLKGVAIDMPAGSSEVGVLVDESANPVFIAADLLSQVEHRVDSQVVLITTSEKLQMGVVYEVERQLGYLNRHDIVEKSLTNNKLILMKDMGKALELTNAHAPEHLIIKTKNYMEVSGRIINVGSVSPGVFSPESAGDYASRTNHTLSTNGYIKAYSGVSLNSPVRKITFQEVLPDGMVAIGPAIEVMTANERSDTHKDAVIVRLKEMRK